MQINIERREAKRKKQIQQKDLTCKANKDKKKMKYLKQ